MFQPQHSTLRLERRAQVWRPPALTWVAFVTALTITGVKLGVLVPLPISPLSLSPQHSTLRLERRAQVWRPPALTWMAFVIPLTGTEVELFFVVPSPSWSK